MSGAADPYADAVTFRFGDSPELADALLALVMSGRKTATCGALRDYGGAEPAPEVGRRDVVLDGSGRRAAVIETVEAIVRRFDEVDADFARDEGEGDLSYEYWHEAHRAYFERNGGFSPDMKLVCERFRLVEVFAEEDAKV
ncbi:ASCH domain-containing protein [Mesorhizobium loti]|uniref:ASCH domain-containing protein n=1 Tax=Rhizobium loti TaxID=381 RepID=UPI0003FCE920|nr:ASCH domain-containing protein [Mesorhizobium loti]